MGNFITSDPALDDEARRQAKHKQPEQEQADKEPEQPERKPRRGDK